MQNPYYLLGPVRFWIFTSFLTQLQNVWTWVIKERFYINENVILYMFVFPTRTKVWHLVFYLQQTKNLAILYFWICNKRKISPFCQPFVSQEQSGGHKNKTVHSPSNNNYELCAVGGRGSNLSEYLNWDGGPVLSTSLFTALEYCRVASGLRVRTNGGEEILCRQEEVTQQIPGLTTYQSRY